MSATQSPNNNTLLAALPPEEWERLFPHLERVSVPLGEVLHESGERIGYVYFPTDCIISLLYVMADGHMAEVAIVGKEGMVGVELFMGGEMTFGRALAQSAGHLYRLKKHCLTEAFDRSATLRQLLLRYASTLFAQIAQTAVCNRHHSLEQQLCRWLLLSLDRLGANELIMTQELIANMLGVRREGVTEAAGKLQKAGVIRYRRGHINVLDRHRLEDRACECYRAIRKELDRLLPSSRAAHEPPGERSGARRGRPSAGTRRTLADKR